MGQELWKRLTKCFRASESRERTVISRNGHKVSRKQVSPNALKVLYRLNKAGYAAYLVGGSVRDLLLKRKPKDFDVATDAHPEEVKALFRNSRLIGRRFRLVHVYFYDEVIEVSTFRANSENPSSEEAGEMPAMISSDNTYGTIEEDAWRRDFTVNALYYNIENFSVVDFTGGMLDLKRRSIRMIGDPAQRYHEDPVRLLRAIRLSSKLGLTIEEQTEAPLQQLSHLLWHVAPARLFDEILKLFFEGNAIPTYESLLRYGYMRVIFPVTSEAIQVRQEKCDIQLIKLAMKATDARFANGQSLNPGFLMAVLLWPAVQLQIEKEKKRHKHLYQVLHLAIDNVLQRQAKTVSIPKRLTAMMRSVWMLQYHLIRRRGKRVYRSLTHRYFRAAFDFLELRAKSGEDYQDVYQWWRHFQDGDQDQRADLVEKLMQDRK